jgi:hypothetical protein
MAAPLLRIYRPRPYGSSACGFRYEGPFSRFDHHADGHLRGIHYSAPSLSSCVALFDLRGSGAMRAGSVIALSATADRSLSQQWSRFFYGTAIADERPIDGLLYSNAHNGESALALYERAEAAIHCEAELPLAADELRSRLLAIANDHGMTMASSGS